MTSSTSTSQPSSSPASSPKSLKRILIAAVAFTFTSIYLERQHSIKPSLEKIIQQHDYHHADWEESTPASASVNQQSSSHSTISSAISSGADITTTANDNALSAVTTEGIDDHGDHDMIHADKSMEQDEASSSIEAMKQYRIARNQKIFYNDWFDPNDRDQLKINADVNGTVLDFIISGFPKCGTTTMSSNLALMAPMDKGDICTPLSQTVYYSYHNWPEQYGTYFNGDDHDEKTDPKLLRGSKCPRFMQWLQKEFALRVPRTPIIVGIRHPILFFQSFWNMLADNNNRRFSNKSPYDFTEHCAENDRSCSYECKGPNALLCLHRSRFHLWLARSGKTLLTNTERELLAPDDKDGGMKLTNRNMTNPLFVYEISQLKHDYLWDELALLLKVPNIPHDIYKGNKDDRKPSPNRIDICDRQYDDFRAMIMPHAYNMSKWLCDYFVPRAKDESKSDVIIAKPDVFCETVKSYELDPCNRLVRMDNGVYLIPPDSSMSRNSSNKIVLK